MCDDCLERMNRKVTVEIRPHFEFRLTLLGVRDDNNHALTVEFKLAAKDLENAKKILIEALRANGLFGGEAPLKVREAFKTIFGKDESEILKAIESAEGTTWWNDDNSDRQLAHEGFV